MKINSEHILKPRNIKIEEHNDRNYHHLIKSQVHNIMRKSDTTIWFQDWEYHHHEWMAQVSEISWKVGDTDEQS
jgi:hypothetical protein